MQLPLQITYRNLESSEPIEAAIRKEGEVLDKIFGRIMRCHVVVEASHKRHHQGNLYQVRINLTVPGKELAVSRMPDQQQAHEDLYVAIRDAFTAAGRQLESYASRKRRDVKTHEIQPHGKISELFIEEGYGTIESSDGSLVYFHRNSVLNADFGKLSIDTKVSFVEEEGEKGPQASTVKVVGKH